MDPFADDHDAIVQTWLGDALRAVEPRRGDRALMLTGHATAPARGMLSAVGRHETVLVIEPDRYLANLLQTVDERLTVSAQQLDASLRFGSFDVVFACADRIAEGEVATWAAIAANNLRLGGRLGFDVPADDFSAVLTQCWLDAGGSDASLEHWHGPTVAAANDALSSAGLRSVDAVVATHLVQAESARSLAAFALRTLRGDVRSHDALSLALTTALRTNGPVEIPVRRLRVTARR